MARRPKRLRSLRRPRLSIPQILGWADEFFAANGKWPTVKSGPIPGTINDKWHVINTALVQGLRGLPSGSNLSLARLLEKHRGVRNANYPPKLSAAKIAKWAKNHRRVHGDWPHDQPEAIDDAPGETWLAIDMALRKGHRGLPGGSSLARFLSDRFGVRNHLDLPPLTEAQILAWADAHFRRWERERCAAASPSSNCSIGSGPTCDGDAMRDERLTGLDVRSVRQALVRLFVGLPNMTFLTLFSSGNTGCFWVAFNHLVF